MYEELTYEYLLQRMLDRVPDGIDKREGSIIYDALAPDAAELAQLYIEMDQILNEGFADTASRTNLIRRGKERGIEPKVASKAIVKAVFNINIAIGARFFIGNLFYVAIEKIQDCQFKMACETAGSVGNYSQGDLVPVDYIDGLKSAKLTEVLIYGEEEEETEDFRERYYLSFDTKAFGGNQADYREQANKLQGVGGAKVYPAWNGGGSVKLVIISSQFNKPTKTLIETVQNIIDPVLYRGQGVGLAPIGHVVTVEGVSEFPINILMSITYQNGWSWEDIKANVQNTIDKYFLELASTWESTKTIENNGALTVRVSQIETRILNLAGVLDIAEVSLNGIKSNLTLAENQIPIRGDVNV